MKLSEAEKVCVKVFFFVVLRTGVRHSFNTSHSVPFHASMARIPTVSMSVAKALSQKEISDTADW